MSDETNHATRRWFFGAAAVASGCMPSAIQALDRTDGVGERPGPGLHTAADTPLASFKQSLAGAVPRAISGKLEEIVSVHDFGGPDVAGAVRLQRAIDSGATQIFIPDAVPISGTVTSDGNVRIYGPGTLDMSGGGHLVVGSGSRRIADLSEDVGWFTTEFTFKGAHGLIQGDVFSVWNPTDRSFARYRDTYRAGDMFRVAEVLSSTSIRIYGIVKEVYAAAEVQVHKLSGGWFELDGVTVIPPPAGKPLDIDGCVGVRLNGVKIPAGADYVGININRSYDVGITDPEITALVDDAYPIVIGSCQKVTITATRGLYSRRHCLGFGGGDQPGSVPCADVRIIGMLADNIITNGVGAADIHGNCKRITYESCVLSGANIAGEDVTYRGCYITGLPPTVQAEGSCIYGTEGVGGLFLIENCTLVSAGTGNGQGSHIHVGVSHRSKPFRLVARNNTYVNVGPDPAATQLIMVSLASSTPRSPNPRVDIEIDGGAYLGAAPPGAVLNINGAEEVSATCSVRIPQNISGTRRLYSSSINYAVDFEGPGLRKGVSLRGDTDVVLTRDTARQVQHYSLAAITTTRTLTLPEATDCVPGDLITVSRLSGGPGAIDIGPGLKSLTGGNARAVIVAFTGGPAAGSWTVIA